MLKDKPWWLKGPKSVCTQPHAKENQTGQSKGTKDLGCRWKPKASYLCQNSSSRNPRKLSLTDGKRCALVQFSFSFSCSHSSGGQHQRRSGPINPVDHACGGWLFTDECQSFYFLDDHHFKPIRSNLVTVRAVCALDNREYLWKQPTWNLSPPIALPCSRQHTVEMLCPRQECVPMDAIRHSLRMQET